MSAINSISVDKLIRLIGTPRCPALIDVRPKDDFDSSPRLIPGSVRRTHSDVPEWAGEFNGQSAVPRNAPRSSRNRRLTLSRTPRFNTRMRQLDVCFSNRPF
jgi:hypothetical protein